MITREGLMDIRYGGVLESFRKADAILEKLKPDWEEVMECWAKAELGPVQYGFIPSFVVPKEFAGKTVTVQIKVVEEGK